ncbi:MAG: UvrB/UvrC motif-containing protein [Gemmatimonadota bacterium]
MPGVSGGRPAEALSGRDGADMRCENCGEREAEVHLTEIEGGEMRTSHLCPSCAAQKGVAGTLAAEKEPLTDFLAQIGGSAESAGTTPKLDQCPFCGTSPQDFRQTGRLGCPQCYTHFAVQLRGLLRRVHGASQHTGKIYLAETDAVEGPEVRLASLRRRLERAVEIEDFECAARLRDQIHELEAVK